MQPKLTSTHNMDAKLAIKRGRHMHANATCSQCHRQSSCGGEPNSSSCWWDEGRRRWRWCGFWWRYNRLHSAKDKVCAGAQLAWSSQQLWALSWHGSRNISETFTFVILTEGVHIYLNLTKHWRCESLFDLRQRRFVRSTASSLRNYTCGGEWICHT